MSFGEKFKSLLEKTETTTYKMSKDTSIPDSTIGRWRNGKTVPSVEQAVEICKYFGIGLNYFDDEQKEKSTPVSESGLEPEINEIFTMLKNASLEDRCKARDMVALLLGQNPKNP